MKKTTVTIGIPLYNEAQNIGHLMESIFKQKQRSFYLQKIQVICDGSTDATVEIVKSYIKKYPIIFLKVYKQRFGKTARLNELYQANKADYLLTLDGDIILGTDMEIEKVLDVARETKSQVVAAHQIPNKIRGFIGRISYANHILWTGVRVRVNGGNYIQNLQGAATLIAREFARSLRYPVGIVCDQRYLYIKASRKNTFAFSANSKVIYQPLSTFTDWNRLNRRLLSENKYLHTEFGNDIKELYEPALKYKFQGMFAALKKDPFYTILALLTCYIFKLIMLFQKPDIDGLWPTLTSTKESIVPQKLASKRNLLLFIPLVKINFHILAHYCKHSVNHTVYSRLLSLLIRKTVIRI